MEKIETLDLPIDTCIKVVHEYIETLMYCISQGESDYTFVEFVGDLQDTCAGDPPPRWESYHPSEPYGSPEWYGNEIFEGRHRIV